MVHLTESTSGAEGGGAVARPAMTEERLLEALDAWNQHDPELVLSFVASDCVYHASVGPELLGRSYFGREHVRQGILNFFNTYPDGRFMGTEVRVDGDHGSAEWIFVVPSKGLELRGCDLFEFDGDLIKAKNAFRKTATDDGARSG